MKLIHCGNNSLVNPRDQSEKNIFFMPMGLFALASALGESGVEVEIIHSDAEKGRAIDRVLAVDQVDAVGFDCHWVNQSLVVLETARALKESRPGLFVFLGGFTASLFAEEILADHPEIDAIIRGDAELPIVALCRALDARGQSVGPRSTTTRPSLAGVPNLAWRAGDGGIRLNDFSYVATAEDLEKLDFASLDLLRHWEYYRKRSIYWTRFAPFGFAPLNLSPLFFLEIGRGCANTCLFCGGNRKAQQIINNRDSVAVRSVESVVATIEKAMSFGFRTFLSDLEFEGSDRWYGSLFEQIRRNQLEIHYVYSAWGITPPALLDALSETFERAFVQLSPETADVELRKRNKGRSAFYTNEELRRCLDYIDTKGNLRVQLYFGYFLAFDTPETVFRTLEFIMELILEYPDLIEIAYLPFSTDPGSLLFLHPDRFEVNCGVRSFRDFIENIEDSYLTGNTSHPDMRLSEPRSMAGASARNLERQIELFNHLFRAHRESLSHLLRARNGPETVLKLLRETGDAVTSGDPEKVVGALRDVCGAGNLLDARLVETLDAECRMQQRPRQQVFQARPEIWLAPEAGG